MTISIKPMGKKFNNLFANLAVGLDQLPEDMSAAVRRIQPEVLFPPPWQVWLTFVALRYYAGHHKARKVLQRVVPRTVPQPEGFSVDRTSGNESLVVPLAVDIPEWSCKVDLDRRAAVIELQGTSEQFSFPLRLMLHVMPYSFNSSW